MLLRRCLLATRNFYPLRQPANITKHTLHRDILQRFSSSANLDGDQPNNPKSDENVDRKLEFLKLEMRNLRDGGHRVPEPDLIKPQHWDELLKCETGSARRRYYNFLFINEKKNENEKVCNIGEAISHTSLTRSFFFFQLKKQEKKRAYLAFKDQQTQEENPHVSYALNSTALFLRIYGRTMDFWRNNR